MKRIYRGFKTECPTGLITEEAFHGIYARFFPNGGKHFNHFLPNGEKIYSFYVLLTDSRNEFLFYKFQQLFSYKNLCLIRKNYVERKCSKLKLFRKYWKLNIEKSNDFY